MTLSSSRYRSNHSEENYYRRWILVLSLERTSKAPVIDLEVSKFHHEIHRHIKGHRNAGGIFLYSRYREFWIHSAGTKHPHIYVQSHSWPIEGLCMPQNALHCEELTLEIFITIILPHKGLRCWSTIFHNTVSLLPNPSYSPPTHEESNEGPELSEYQRASVCYDGNASGGHQN